MSSFWNFERNLNIVCPYCGREYEPSYEETCIGGEPVDCYTEGEETYTCEECGKNLPCRVKTCGYTKQKPLMANAQRKKQKRKDGRKHENLHQRPH